LAGARGAGALRAFAPAPLDPALLIVVALGMVAFGLFSWCEARWWRVLLTPHSTGQSRNHHRSGMALVVVGVKDQRALTDAQARLRHDLDRLLRVEACPVVSGCGD